MSGTWQRPGRNATLVECGGDLDWHLDVEHEPVETRDHNDVARAQDGEKVARIGVDAYALDTGLAELRIVGVCVALPGRIIAPHMPRPRSRQRLLSSRV